eukprot:589708-Amphidinium_carterae.1
MRTRAGKSFWSTRYHYYYDKGVSNLNLVKATQLISKESELGGSNSVEPMELDVQILGTANGGAVADAPEPSAPPERFSKQQRNRTSSLLSLLGKCR